MNYQPTPETDAQGFGDGLHPWVATDFARKLERERNEARAQNAKLLNKLDKLYRDAEIERFKKGAK